MVEGVNTRLSIQPSVMTWPSAPPVWVYGSYVWSHTNGTSALPYATGYTNNNGYVSMSLLTYTAASNATVAQMLQDRDGATYYLTSEFNRQFTGGTWVDVLVGYYLHAGGQVLALVNKPLRLALVGTSTDCSAQVFVLESDANNHGVVEGFKLTYPTPGCGPWYRFGAVSLAAGAPVDIGIVSGQVVVLGSGAAQGSGGVVYVLPESLGSISLGPDYTPARTDGTFVTLKGFARDANDAVAVEGAGRFSIYGDVLYLGQPGPYHLAYYVAKHSTLTTGFVEGNYPPPVTPVAPQPTGLAGRHAVLRVSSLTSVGVSTGAVLGGGLLYVTGSASLDGYNVTPKTAYFSESGGQLLPNANVLTHPYPSSSGIALDNSGKIYVGAGGQVGAQSYVLAFQAYDPAQGLIPAGSGQCWSANVMAPTSLLLRRYLNHSPDVFLGGSMISPDSQHMYTGVTTQFSTP
jgi:hypothetical protein